VFLWYCREDIPAGGNTVFAMMQELLELNEFNVKHNTTNYEGQQ
jgi:hypothetical protein